MIKYFIEVKKLSRFYYNELKKEEKKKIRDVYKKEYSKSEFQKRLVRLAIYSAIGFLFSIFLVIYVVIKKESIIANLFIAIPLFIASLIFLIGRSYAKLILLNKIALKEHKK